jgi:hypothetical protein
LNKNPPLFPAAKYGSFPFKASYSAAGNRFKLTSGSFGQERIHHRDTAGTELIR